MVDYLLFFFFSYRKEGCPQAVRWSRLPAPTSAEQKEKEKRKFKLNLV